MARVLRAIYGIKGCMQKGTIGRPHTLGYGNKEWVYRAMSGQTSPIVSAPTEETTLEKSILTTERGKIINPLEHEDFFDVRNLVTLRGLFQARVHLGHKEGSRHENMKPFLFGTRLGVDIIDLEQTLPLLQDVLNFTAHVAYRGGVFMFLTRHLQTLTLVETMAKECGEYSHCREWKQGTFTNATVQFGAITRLPDVCIFLSTHNTVFMQSEALVEAAKMNIPTIGILDSSCDPTLISYPVPGNDDSPSAIELYCKLFKESILRGKAKRKEMSTP